MKCWTAEEDEFLRNNYGKMLHKDIAQALNRPIGAIDSRRRRLHIEAEGITSLMHRLHTEGKHPMQRPEVVANFFGENNPSFRPDVRKKISEKKKAEYANGNAKSGWREGSRGNVCPTVAESILLELMPEFEWNRYIHTGITHLHYQLDLSNLEKMICVEVDGSSHRYAKERDERKDAFLISKGWTVIRVTNEEVFSDPVGTVKKIMSVVKDRVSHL